MFARILAILLTTSYILLASPVYAQTPIPFGTGQAPIPAYISPTSPIYTDLLVNNLFHSFSCLAIGSSIIGQPCLTYQVTKNAEGTIQSVPMLSQVNLSGGALGAVAGVIDGLYQNPPVRTADYLASVSQSFGVKEAHAQVSGSGAGVLSPILSLWQVSRNISYVFMIIIFIIIGLMVMFRNKINPQTVITAQAALPGLVIGLIMITFSYFLAGLISDMAFVGTNVVGYYFSAVNGHADTPQNLVNDMSNENVLKIFGHFAGLIDSGQITNALQLIYDSLGPNVQGTVNWFAGLLAFQFIAPLGAMAGPSALIVGPILGAVSGLFTMVSPVQTFGFFLQFIVVFILLYAMFKLLLRLISSYLTIIFLTITAPFQFLYSALPGRQEIATGWILNMLANILVFPTVIAVFYFVAFLLGDKIPPFTEAYEIQQRNNTFISTVYAAGTNNIVGEELFPLFGGLNLVFIKLLIAFGALIALPTIPDIIVKAVGKAGQAGQLIGQEISGGSRTGQGYFNQNTGRITEAGQSVGTGIMGESQHLYDPTLNNNTGGFRRVQVKPGAASIVGGWLGGRPGGGGGGGGGGGAPS